VSPLVVVSGYWHSEPDEADYAGWNFIKTTWDTVEGEDGGRRIRLSARLELAGGEHSQITQLGYHLTAVGDLLAPG
jgi:hypothetical protein